MSGEQVGVQAAWAPFDGRAVPAPDEVHPMRSSDVAMTAATLTLADFLLARLDEDGARSWVLVPYRCPPGCCAPAGWVGHRCLICDDATSYGGTVAAIEEIAGRHADRVHRRAFVAADIEAKRALIGWAETMNDHITRAVLRTLALPYADHLDYREEWRP